LGFLDERQVALATTGAALVFVRAGNNFTITAHGLAAGAGPFLATSATTLPAGIVAGQFYWIHNIVDVNTVQLTTRKGGQAISAATDDGTGTHTLTKADSDPAIYEYLRQNAPEVLRDATDVDDL